ncbi:MAG: FAD-dependent monooxygenase, partial [Myxococcales bacterium]|nr:FAD-dependent monooxygenase [Myxococcales bacterium]
MLDVLMVGAGIGGLTAARSLARGGASVALVERAARPSAAGAGIVLGGNAMACLDALELGSAVAARGRAVDEMEISDRTGRTLRRTSVALPGLPAPVAVHRHALHEALQDGVSGVPLHAGTTVEALREEGDAVECTLSSGEVLRARLVVGADGIGSQIRKLAFGAPERAYAGYTCWRAVVPDPGVPHPVEMWGRGQRVGLVPQGAGQLYMFLVADAPAGTPG